MAKKGKLFKYRGISVFNKVFLFRIIFIIGITENKYDFVFAAFLMGCAL